MSGYFSFFHTSLFFLFHATAAQRCSPPLMAPSPLNPATPPPIPHRRSARLISLTHCYRRQGPRAGRRATAVEVHLPRSSRGSAI